MNSMRNRFKIQLYKNIIGYGFLIFILTSIIAFPIISGIKKSIKRNNSYDSSISSSVSSVQHVIKKEFERAYFEGQRDAIEGDIRIKKTRDNCWIWTKTCWDSGQQTEYEPCLNLK